MALEPLNRRSSNCAPPHEIVFACDNGERYLKQTKEDLLELTKGGTPLFRKGAELAAYAKYPGGA